jgi:thiaminase
MTVNFADELRQRSTEIWKKILNHRFIIELANNTLPVDKFLFYLKQDHYFLGDFSKFLRSAKQKAINNKMNQWLDGLYVSKVDFEMEMQRQMLRAIDTSSSLSAASSYPHSKLIISLRTVVDNDRAIDKESTSYNDIFDAFRLALKFYHFEESYD